MFDDVRSSLAELNPTQLRDVILLANHLRPVDPIECNYHGILCDELESIFGCGPNRSQRMGTARRLYAKMKQLGSFGSYHDIARSTQRVVTAIKNAMRRDDAPLTWEAANWFIANLESVLEREYPHYRLTGILSRRA